MATLDCLLLGINQHESVSRDRQAANTIMRIRHVVSEANNIAWGSEIKHKKVYRGVNMKPNSQNVPFPSPNTNLSRFYMFAGLMALFGFGILSTMRAAQDQSGVPVFKFTPEGSIVNFNVSASVPITGKFNKWDAGLTFTSRELSTGVLDIKIDAASVDTGSGMKDGKLRSKDFFDAKDDPYITFHSTKIEQTGPDTFDVSGTFTIRGVSKPEKLTFTSTGKGTGTGELKGTMAFDRKEYGMNSGIPFIKIADRVEVSLDIKGKRVTGPPPNFKE
jgi:polyisoprenoid-binding protein YceI